MREQNTAMILAGLMPDKDCAREAQRQLTIDPSSRQREHPNQPSNQPILWRYSASELYRPSDRCLSAKLVPTFADRRVSHGQCGGSPTAVISVF
jgi:hypothetical protein